MAFLILFGGGTMVFVAGSELLVRFVVAPRNGYELYKNEFRTTQATTAVFGDSHVADSIETSQQIVNLGYPSDTLPLMLAKAERYAASGHARRVVLQFSPEQFAVYRVNTRQDEVADDLFSRTTPLLQFMRPHFRRYLLEYWKTIINNPALLWMTEPTTNEGPAAAPPTFADLPAAEQRRSAEIRVQLQTPLPAGPVVDRMVAQLGDSLDALQRRHLEVCLVEFPLTGAYRRAAATIPSFADLRVRTKKLATDKNVKFVDLTESLPDSLFGDSDHVAPAGRVTVTRLVLQGCFSFEPTAAR